ncbi:MAG: primosomal protein N' [Rickettsiales bacterium]|jgi:primosomal protein N' (replication factor Y)|nr:primosomal protein N' [Rickettsiales bacterium]
MNNRIVSVAAPLAVDSCFDYLAPADAEKGDLVKINLNNRTMTGLVFGVRENDGKSMRLKSIGERLPLRFSENFTDFLRWVGDYNLIPPGLVFKLAFSEKFLTTTARVGCFYRFLADGKHTGAQRPVMDFLRSNSPNFFSPEQLKGLCSLGILKTLVKNSILEEEKRQLNGCDSCRVDMEKVKLNVLTPSQLEIFQKIRDLDDKKPILLDGVTGSGKTEIYFHLFRHYLSENGNQALFLLPEIALTNQFIDRFKSQFNCQDVAVWHSAVGDGKKSVLWQGVHNGDIKIIIGARSSLFLPFKNLKLIVLDEEHDGSYKQTDNGCYSARDMATVRAKFENCKIALGSATPSIESLLNVERNKYNYFYLQSRYGKSLMPTVEVVDLRKEKLKNDKYLSPTLIANMGAELEKGGQVLLFMNRRGYSPIALCQECGHRFLCKNCSCNLAAHSKKHKLICHQCGHSIEQTSICPNCGGKDSVIFFGPGVEKIEKEAKEIFKDRETVIVASDTTENGAEIRKIMRQIQEKKADIIIGTQMITKGYDFERLTLVGIIDADASLFGANFRATERTYQLLTQVAGRAGRRESAGKVVIQTHNPDNLIIQSMVENDKNKILDFEKENRRRANLPPFGSIIMLVFHSEEEILAYRKAKEFAGLFPAIGEIDVLGPTPTNLYKINGIFRFKILLRGKNGIFMQKITRDVLKKIKLGKVKIKIDVNPYFIV